MYFAKKRERNSKLGRNGSLALGTRTRLRSAMQNNDVPRLVLIGHQRARGIQDPVNLGPRDAVVDIPPVTSIDHEAGFAQDHQ